MGNLMISAEEVGEIATNQLLPIDDGQRENVLKPTDDQDDESDKVRENVPSDHVPLTLLEGSTIGQDPLPGKEMIVRAVGTPPGTPQPRVIMAPSSIVAMAQRLSEEPLSPVSPSTEERRNPSGTSLELPGSPQQSRVRRAYTIAPASSGMLFSC